MLESFGQDTAAVDAIYLGGGHGMLTKDMIHERLCAGELGCLCELVAD